MPFPPFGSMPNNAIVGGSADIALGSALFKLINRKKGIVIANIGDASLGCGPVWESFSFASMDQFEDLWDKEFGFPPILFNIMNNHYGMGGQAAGETMGFDIAARVGAGINPSQMHAERVDGYNPLAVADATLRCKNKLIKGKGPTFLDIVTYRISGHSPSDASSYRSKEEMDLWQQNDCIDLYKNYLVSNKIINENDVQMIKSQVVTRITNTLSKVVDENISPYSNAVDIENVMFSNKKIETLDNREPETLLPLKENPRVKQLARKERYAFNDEGAPISANKLFTYRDGIFEAMAHRFYNDSTFVAYGEENRDWGGAFACYRGLTESLPYHRLFNSPISEGAIVGTACGYALSGGRVCAELMYCDFMGRAGDEIFNQISKWQAMSAGILNMPLVLRISVGNKYGAQHSQDWSAMVAHIPGLKIFYPATPTDAKGMLNLALSGTDPVIFFESQKTYGIGEQFETEGVPKDYYETAEGEPAIRRKGSDLTIISIGPVLYSGMSAAAILKEKFGLEAEVIDLRFINPLNYDSLISSVQKTGRVVLASDSVEKGSFLHTVASNLTTLCFDDLDAPPAVIGSKNWITPAAEMEKNSFLSQTGLSLQSTNEFYHYLILTQHKTIQGRRLVDLQKKGYNELSRMAASIKNSVIKTEETNNHVHSHYSFSPYSPTDIVTEALKAGIQTVGLMDHDSVAGAHEFISAGQIMGIATTVGCEIRASLDNTIFKNKRLNNPDENNIIYMAFHGIPHQNLEKVEDFLNPFG